MMKAALLVLSTLILGQQWPDHRGDLQAVAGGLAGSATANICMAGFDFQTDADCNSFWENGVDNVTAYTVGGVAVCTINASGITTVGISSRAIGGGVNSEHYGEGSSASGAETVSIGDDASVGSDNSVGIGSDVTIASTADTATVVGSLSGAVGISSDRATIVGYNSSTLAADSVLLGDNITVTAGSSNAIVGTPTSTISGGNVTLIGNGIDGGVGISSIVGVGQGVVVSATSSTVVGQGASGAGTSSVIVGANSSIASGSIEATVVGFNADITGATGDRTVLIGATCASANSDSVCVGYGCSTAGNGSTNVGANLSVSGNPTTLFGQSAEGLANGVIGIGFDPSVQGTNGIFIKPGTAARSLSGASSIVVGDMDANSSGANAVCIGTALGLTNATTDNILLGTNANDGGFSNCTAIGEGATCTAANQSFFADSVTAPNITGTTFTPTLTNVTNLDASTAFQCQYIRIASSVTVSCKVDVDPTAVLVVSQLGISLPVASNFGAQEDCAGAGSAIAALETGGVLADTVNDRCQFDFIAQTTANHSAFLTFTYQVI